jgi:hypothetical protein
MSRSPTRCLAAALAALAAASPVVAGVLPSQADAILCGGVVAQRQSVKDAGRLAALRRQADCYQRCLAASRAAAARLPAADLPEYLRGVAQREATLGRIYAEIDLLERRVKP